MEYRKEVRQLVVGDIISPFDGVAYSLKESGHTITKIENDIHPITQRPVIYITANCRKKCFDPRARLKTLTKGQ